MRFDKSTGLRCSWLDRLLGGGKLLLLRRLLRLTNLARRLLIHVFEGLDPEDLRCVPLALLSDEVSTQGHNQLLFVGILLTRYLHAAHEVLKRLNGVVFDLFLNVTRSVRVFEDLLEGVTLLLRGALGRYCSLRGRLPMRICSSLLTLAHLLCCLFFGIVGCV